MQVKTPGYRYVLQNFEDPFDSGTEVRFIRREKSPVSDQLVTVHNGTTNEELIEVLRHRIGVLNKIMPDKENSTCLRHLGNALNCLKRRTADREKRGVEGTNNP